MFTISTIVAATMHIIVVLSSIGGATYEVSVSSDETVWRLLLQVDHTPLNMKSDGVLVN